jgi:MerR family transcriptional regulator, copper efflux regulator
VASTFTLGKLARAAGVGAETVRYYERVGLLEAPARAANGYRRYDATALGRLRFVRQAAALGFSLAEIAELLELRARRGQSCGGVRERAVGKLARIDAKLAELQAMRRAVASLIASCEGDTVVESCSILNLIQSTELTQPRGEEAPCPARAPCAAASKPAKRASKTV